MTALLILWFCGLCVVGVVGVNLPRKSYAGQPLTDCILVVDHEPEVATVVWRLATSLLKRQELLRGAPKDEPYACLKTIEQPTLMVKTSSTIRLTPDAELAQRATLSIPMPITGRNTIRSCSPRM